MDEGLLYLEREGNIYFSQPKGKGKKATVYIGYCFQVYRGEMCSFFYFYKEMKPRVIMWYSGSQAKYKGGSVKLLDKAGQPEGSWWFYKGATT